MKLTIDNNFLYFDFSGYSPDFIKSFETGISQYTGVREKGYEKSMEYKMGRWDGYTRVYDSKKHRIAVGLLYQCEEYIKKLQEKGVSIQYAIINTQPEPFMEVTDMPESITTLSGGKELTLRDYQYNGVRAAIENEKGVISAAVNSGKSLLSVGIIKTLLPYLEKGEKVAYFVPSLTIFSQIIPEFEENFGKDNVGYIGNSKRKISNINVITLSSMSSALKDPTKAKDVKLTGKSRTLQIFSEEVVPFFDTEGGNYRAILKNLATNYPASTKARTEIKNWLIDAEQTCLTNSTAKMFVNKKHAEYRKIVQEKVGDKYDKYLKTLEFAKDVRIIIVDEGHHSGADQAFNTLLSFPNAQYKFAMTGSYDPGKELQTQRMIGLFGGVIAEVSNDHLISRGISAKPTINLVKIRGKLNLTESEEKDYLRVVEQGIVYNEDRNRVITELVKRMYELDKPSLIIVGRIEHGELLKDMLDKKEVPSVFLQGSVSGEERERILEDFKAGKTKVIIATSIFDEGLSVNSFKNLFMVMSTRSPRLVIQRIGRVLREKKEGSNTATVFDFVDETNIFLKRQADARMEIYKKEKFETKSLN